MSESNQEALLFAIDKFGFIGGLEMSYISHLYPEWLEHKEDLEKVSRVYMDYIDFFDEPDEKDVEMICMIQVEIMAPLKILQLEKRERLLQREQIEF